MAKDPILFGTRPPRDIQADSLQDLDWSPQEAAKALARIARYASEYAAQSATWYLRFKRWKRRAARWLRFLAILFVAAAGVLPMVQQLLVKSDGKVAVAPVWASIFLAAAVFLVALDRFFGFSSGWIRYVLAEAQIRRLRQQFELDWQTLLASYAGQPPNGEQIRHALAWAKAFVEQVNAIIGDETTKWVSEFQEALKQVDDQVRPAPPTAESGSLEVTVSNGDAIAAPGWDLAVDQGQPRVYSGKTAAIVGLLPGDYALRLKGMANGKELRAEVVATVRSSALTAVEVTLS